MGHSLLGLGILAKQGKLCCPCPAPENVEVYQREEK
jgi:hypothetical protein